MTPFGSDGEPIVTGEVVAIVNPSFYNNREFTLEWLLEVDAIADSPDTRRLVEEWENLSVSEQNDVSVQEVFLDATEDLLFDVGVAMHRDPNGWIAWVEDPNVYLSETGRVAGPGPEDGTTTEDITG